MRKRMYITPYSFGADIELGSRGKWSEITCLSLYMKEFKITGATYEDRLKLLAHCNGILRYKPYVFEDIELLSIRQISHTQGELLINFVFKDPQGVRSCTVYDIRQWYVLNKFINEIDDEIPIQLKGTNASLYTNFEDKQMLRKLGIPKEKLMVGYFECIRPYLCGIRVNWKVSSENLKVGSRLHWDIRLNNNTVMLFRQE